MLSMTRKGEEEEKRAGGKEGGKKKRRENLLWTVRDNVLSSTGKTDVRLESMTVSEGYCSLSLSSANPAPFILQKLMSRL